ncbi:adenine nucleotide translocator 1 [Paenibacillus stellifer]|uniref:Adenine nucleotide translocator 1 n=1 Tax=Paenibacillus stellifer TaxID=169760 RepID=A0A089LXL3_9BACL|nr:MULTISPECIES: BMP family ABC transporter substrate-binding protein [Paenibacillus]AIQ64860.1 adenine nucleotide translocator 1 [Paenibacillus stellifer]MBY9081372.1 BMP family ABC transporter substrate-binding protein [Paenibacillus sp. CGMCC 1.18879]MBY9084892.1 BMP family ABC transporter substrate-binding protein [Paenibacillus sinensis]
MKKMLALVSVLMLVILTACSGSGNSATGNTAATSSNAPAASEAAASKDGDKLKVVLLIPGNLGDKSFLDSANRGLELVRDQLGATTKVIEMGTDQTKWEPIYRDVVEQDWDLIISGNSTASEIFHAIAAEHPEKKFIDFDTDFEDVPDNVYAMWYRVNDASFLAGAAAALTTTSNLPNANPEKIIGFLGGLDVPGINAFLVGYIEGAQYVVPDIKVITSYAGDFGDPAKGKELSLVQYNSGADVIFGAAGGTGLGIFDAAKEKKKYAIGVDSDQAEMVKGTDPDKANLILTSSMKNIDQSILRAVKKYQEGTLEFGKRETLSFTEGAVGIAKNDIYNAAFTPEMKAKIEEIEKKLINKEIVVSDASKMETSEVEKIRNAVKP